MRAIILALASMVFASTTTGQPYSILSQKTIGCSSNDLFYHFMIDNDGNYVAAGQTAFSCTTIGTGIGKTDGWVIKLDTSGKTIWSTVVGDAQDEYLSKIIQTQDGGYLAVGSSLSNTTDPARGNYDYWVVKLDRSGTVLWEKYFGGTGVDQASDVVETSDGGYMVVGTVTSKSGDISRFRGGVCDAWVIKVDHQGNLIWDKAFGSSQADNAFAVIRTSTNTYAVLGRAGTADGDVQTIHSRDDAWLINLDIQGNILWSKTYGGNAGEQGRAILETKDGGFLLGCITTSTDGDISRNYGAEDLWAVKTDRNGAILWEHNYGGSASDNLFRSMIESMEGGYLLFGGSESNDLDALGNHGAYGDVLAIKISDSGLVQWSHMFGGSSGEGAPTAYQLADSSYLFGTLTQSGDGDVKGSHGSGDGWIVNFGDPPKNHIGVPVLSSKIGLDIFPNPCRDQIQISGLKSDDQLLDVVDVTGKKAVVPMQRYPDRGVADMSGLPVGMYIFRMLSGDAVSYFKIVRE